MNDSEHESTSAPASAADSAGELLDQVPFTNLLLENIKEVAIFAVDSDGLISTWNAGAERVFGYSASEVLGLAYDTIFPPEVAMSGGPARILEAAARDGLFEEEAWRVRKTGEWFWGDALITPLRTAAGDLVGFGVITRDLSERYQAQSRQRRCIAVFDATSDLVALADAEWQFEYLNPAGRTLLGIPMEEDVGALSVQAIHPPWAGRVLLGEALPSAVERGIWRGDSALLSRDGREIPVSQVVIAVRTADGAVEFLASIARDISAHRQAEAMQQFLIDIGNDLARGVGASTISDRVVQLAVPMLADVCLLDALRPDEQLELIAAAAMQDNIRGKLEPLLDRATPLVRNATVGLHRVLQQHDPELVPDVVDAWLRAAIPDDDRLRVARSLHPRSAMIVPLSAHGRRLGVITFYSSVSGRRFGPADLGHAQQFATRAALAIDNARLYEQLQRAIHSRDEVLAVVAHDLRNPLSTVSMAADLAREPALAQEDRSRQLNIIRRAVGVADRLIGDLLDISRIEAGHLTLDCAPTPLAPLFEEVAEMLRAQAERRAIALDVYMPAGEDLVWADAARLRQVLYNLVGNALKFTGEGGSISIRADPLDDSVRISVLDTGIGIPEDARDHVFDRFWQAKHSPRGSAGLGLAIAKGIVEAHRGRIWVESRAGGGSIFSFTIPRHAQPAPDGAADEQVLAAPASFEGNPRP